VASAVLSVVCFQSEDDPKIRGARERERDRTPGRMQYQGVCWLIFLLGV
jgi:hypothetical protein